MNAASVRAYVTSREWAMDPDMLHAYVEQLSAGLEAATPEAIAAAQAAAAARSESKAPKYQVRDGVAHIAIAGPMLKQVPCAFDLLGMAATSTTATLEAIEAAVADPAVAGIALDVDSPGGEVAGVQELADAIFAARQQKPVEAHISDLGASAAYWVASQADRVTASPTGIIGSIGVYTTLQDLSAAYEQRGVKVHVVRSHELKGVGVPGAPVTATQLQDKQRFINSMNDLFVGAVARGRGIDVARAREHATGQSWIGADAHARGLVDGTSTTKDAHARVVERTKPKPNKFTAPLGAKEKAMDPKELEQKLAEANAKVAAAEAKNQAMQATLEAVQANQRKALIEKHRNRVAPAALASIEKVGETMGADLVGFEAFLSSLPIVTRAERVTEAPSVDPAKAKPEADAGEKQVAKWLGTSVANINRYADVAAFQSDGRFLMKDGSVLTRDELLKKTAAA
jgi:signal peptide peptidase SppA